MSTTPKIRCWSCSRRKPQTAMVFKYGQPSKLCLDCNRRRVRKWKRKNPAKVCAITRAYEKRNRQKRIANKRLLRAVRSGRITRPLICSGCGTPARLHAHHDDYSKPLEVLFLCPQCHSNKHSKRKQTDNEHTDRR